MSIENKVPMSDFTEVTDIADTARIIGLQDNENVKIPLQSLIAKTLSRVDEDILTIQDINVENGVTGFNPIGDVKKDDNRAVSGSKVAKELFKNSEEIGVHNNAFSSANSYLVMNYDFKQNDFIKDLSVQTNEDGKLYISILTRQTFTNTDKTDGGKDVFFENEEIVFDVIKGTNLLPFNRLLNKNQYIGINGSKGVKVTWRTNASVPVINGWWQKVDADYNLTFRNIDINLIANVVNTVYAPIELITSSNIDSININKITVIKNAQNYNSIRNLVHSISDASETNLYEILVPKGVWYETDIFGAKYVKIIGESLTDTILECDPLGVMADYLTPSDYHFPAQRNKPLKDVPLTSRHLFFANSDLNVSNMTIKASNCKYPIHLDSSRMGAINFEKVIIESIDCSYAVGIGVRANNTILFKDFLVKQNNTGKSIFFHNTANQLSGSNSEFINGKFLNCDLFLVDELGSDFTDLLSIINCHSTLVETSLEFMVDKRPDGNTYWTNPETNTFEPDPRKVPYNIFLNTMGTKIDSVKSRNASTFNPSYSGGQRDVDNILNEQITIW